MEKQKNLFLADLAYILILLLFSVFYVFADFSKVISNQLGLAQLIFSIIVLSVFIAVNRSKRAKLPSIIYILYSVAQLIPIINWVVFFSATFHIFPGIIAVNWLFLAMHLLLVMWGIGMVVLQKLT